MLIGKRKNGRYIVADVINRRLDSAEVRELIKMTCIADKAKYGRVITRLPQDPGQAGKAQAQSFEYVQPFSISLKAELLASTISLNWDCGKLSSWLKYISFQSAARISTFPLSMVRTRTRRNRYISNVLWMLVL